MQRYEYKVVPAPKKGTKAKGVKTPEGRFATSIEQLLNAMGADGWDYQRAELLPSEERSGLTGSTVQWRNVLVFRRPITADQPEVGENPIANLQGADDTAQAKPVPGPGEALTSDKVRAPAPISQENDDPPLTLKPAKEDDASKPATDEYMTKQDS